MSKWVRHISGQGEKWEVDEEHVNKCAYRVKGKMTHIHPDLHHYLPKSEYRECDPPEQWEDVTNECYAESVTNDRVRIMLHGENILRQSQEVRIRKIDGMHNGPAFIVERKKHE